MHTTLSPRMYYLIGLLESDNQAQSLRFDRMKKMMKYPYINPSISHQNNPLFFIKSIFRPISY